MNISIKKRIFEFVDKRILVSGKMISKCDIKNYTLNQEHQKHSLLTANLTFMFYTIFTGLCALGFLLNQKRKFRNKVNFFKKLI